MAGGREQGEVVQASLPSRPGRGLGDTGKAQGTVAEVVDPVSTDAKGHWFKGRYILASDGHLRWWFKKEKAEDWQRSASTTVVMATQGIPLSSRATRRFIWNSSGLLAPRSWAPRSLPALLGGPAARLRRDTSRRRAWTQRLWLRELTYPGLSQVMVDEARDAVRAIEKRLNKGKDDKKRAKKPDGGEDKRKKNKERKRKESPTSSGERRAKIEEEKEVHTKGNHLHEKTA